MTATEGHHKRRTTNIPRCTPKHPEKKKHVMNVEKAHRCEEAGVNRAYLCKEEAHRHENAAVNHVCRQKVTPSESREWQ